MRNCTLVSKGDVFIRPSFTRYVHEWRGIIWQSFTDAVIPATKKTKTLKWFMAWITAQNARAISVAAVATGENLLGSPPYVPGP